MFGALSQDDVMVPVLTAFETLYYSALFHTADEADARTRARHVLRILGLEKAADTWVGNSLMKRLSGGEKRRLSVGCALVGSSSPRFVRSLLPPPSHNQTTVITPQNNASTNSLFV
jgi:ABC-type multidrug transport system ATPase subunit